MREQHDSRVTIDPKCRDDFIRPFSIKRHIGKTVRGGKRRTRIDDQHIMSQFTRHRHKRLGDMHRANAEDPQRRCLHADKELRPALFDQRTLTRSKREIEMQSERIFRHRRGIDETLAAIAEFCYQQSRTTRAARFV